MFSMNRNVICSAIKSDLLLCNCLDPSQQVYATFNGLGMPIGLKVSDAMVAQGAEAISLASTQAMVDAHTKAQTMSKFCSNQLR